MAGTKQVIPDPSSMGGRLRTLIDKHGCLALPGCFNGFVGRMAREAGFEAGYISGAGVSAEVGLPDIGLATLDQFCSKIREVSSVADLPCIVDADTGFGEAEMVTRVVGEYHHAGAAGMHLEDQVFPKRCGHLDGKTCVPTQDMVEKVRRAAMARDKLTGGQFIVCARTDARGVEGFEAAVERARQYALAGADMVFADGLASLEEFKQFAAGVQGVPGPAPNGGPYLLANMTEFGKTPYLSVKEFKEAGYHLVIFPMSFFRAAMGAVLDMMHTLKKEGSVEKHLPKMYSREQTYGTLGYTPGEEWSFPAPTPLPKM